MCRAPAGAQAASELNKHRSRLPRPRQPASVKDTGQLDNYLNNGDFGGFGILIAREGFSRNAMDNMSTIAKKGKGLIIPLDHGQVRELARASQHGSKATMEYLRRRETLLVQGN